MSTAGLAMWFVLWHRTGPGSPWSMLGDFATERDAHNAIDRPGDFCVLPAGHEP